MKKGMMISQIEPESRKVSFKTLEVINQVTQDGFFESIQTVEINDREERLAIASIVKSRNLELTYCMARILSESGFNLSSIVKSIRDLSVDKVKSHLEDAIEAGAMSVSLISGPGPEASENRIDAMKCLSDSLFEIGEIIQSMDSSLQVLIEPLDVKAHKKNTLGYTHESIELVQYINKGLGDNIVMLCLDTAHMLLNQENIFCYEEYNLTLLKEFHYCNCVTDRNHDGFGDYHIPFGNPGILDREDIGSIWNALMPELRDNEPSIFFEVKRVDEWSLKKMIDYNRGLFSFINSI